MSNFDIIVKAIDFIETNLREEITVLDIASAVGYSHYHFSRLFHGVASHTPKDYLIRRRLTEAAKEIMVSKRKISAIAFEYQFNDSETFNRAFKRAFGLTPTELRNCAARSGAVKQLPFLSSLSGENIRHIHKIKAIEPEVVSLGPIYLVGLAALMRGSAALITEMWAKFPNDVGRIPNRLIPEKYYQITFWPEIYDLNGCFLMCAVEVSDLCQINLNLVGKAIPPGRYLRFIHKGLSNKVGLTYQYIFETWLPKSDYRLSLPYDFEYYGENYLGPDNDESESEIYIPVE